MMLYRTVDTSSWVGHWGADADHLKTLEDIPPFVEAGYTFFAVDPGAYVDHHAVIRNSIHTLKEKIKEVSWEELSAVYLGSNLEQLFGAFEPETLLARAAVKYGKAIRHTASMYQRLTEFTDNFDFEVSVDETNSPTTPLEHFFIANELTRLGVRFTFTSTHFTGRFEKGVDYIMGNLAALDAEMAKHAAITAHFGTYKLSLHSGSDKFSVYPLIARHWGDQIHVKTAGTSSLEALHVLAEFRASVV